MKSEDSWVKHLQISQADRDLLDRDRVSGSKKTATSIRVQVLVGSWLRIFQKWISNSNSSKGFLP
jgi:hypothetical protein